MPGNEVEDRVHNFFGQENLSQSQHYSQSVADGNWSGLNNNLWVGVQKPVGTPFISSLKNYNLQQPEQERGHGSQASHVSQGLNFAQGSPKPDFTRLQALNQHPALNGYVHGSPNFQGRQGETKFLGVDRDADQHHNLAARGLSISPQENAAEHGKTNAMRLGGSDSPVNFDFFEGQQHQQQHQQQQQQQHQQQQMSGQQFNMLQSMARQQHGNSDVQLLQRQLMLQQLQEFYRQQQLQQMEPRQQGFMNQVPAVLKQTAGNLSPSLINGVPVNEASNSLWQPELVQGGAWVQRGASQVMPSGPMFPPEQGQALRLMDMVPQQADQSLYGVPISGASGGPGSYPLVQMEKPPMQQMPANNNSYAPFPDRVSMQDEARADFQGKNMFGLATGQGLNSGFNLESLQHVNHPESGLSMQEFHGRQEVAESPEPSQERPFNQATTAATLDPTEEKILFGSDDNLWAAFGKSSNMGMGDFNVLGGGDNSDGFPSLQSGSWSALMQSAVAETSNGEAGVQEEWCGPTVQNSETLAGNQQLTSADHDVKRLGVWGGNNFQPPIAQSLRPSPISAEANRPNSGVSSFDPPQFQQSEFKGEMMNADSQRLTPKFAGQGSKWSDRGPPLQKHSVDHSQTYPPSVGHSSGSETNANHNSGSWTPHQTTSLHNSDAQPYNRPGGWNFVSSGQADGGDSRNSLQSGEHKRAMHEELGHVAGMWRPDSAPNAIAVPEPARPSMGRNASSLNNIAVANSSSVRPNQEGVPTTDKLDFWKVIDSSKRAEVLGRNQRNVDTSPQILESAGHRRLDRGMVETHEMDSNSYKDYSADGSKDNNWSDAAGESHAFSGGKQESSGRKVPGTRKFQYHPMGDVGVDHEPSYGTKTVTHSQTSPQQIARGLKMYDQGSFGHPNFGGHMDRTSLELEKGHLSVGQAATKGVDATPPKSVFPGFAPNPSSPFDTGISNHTSNKFPPSSQHMLELLHKVDHQREHGSGTHMSSSERNLSSEMPEAENSEGSVGHVQRNPAQNFGLQLAPPSQRLSSTDHVSHEAGEKGHMHPALRATSVPYPPQGNGHNAAPSSPQIVNKAPYSNHVPGGYSTAFPYARNFENQQHMHAASGQILANQSAQMPFYRIPSNSKQLDGSSEGQFTMPTVQDVSASAAHDKLVSSTETSQLSRTDHIHQQGPGQQILEPDGSPATQPRVQPGALSKMFPNSWTGVPPRDQASLAAQSSKGLFKYELQSNDGTVMTFPGQPKLNVQNTMEGRNELPGTEVVLANSQSFTVKEQLDKEPQVLADKVETAQKTLSGPVGNESVVNNVSEASSAATQRDIEAFGRSLRPNNSPHQNYSLLHQVQTMKSTEIESSDRSSKRLKDSSDRVMDSQQLSHGYNNASANQSSGPSGDLGMLNFSSKPRDAPDSFAFAHNIQSGSGRSGLPPHGISPRMAPSWFDQYGTFRNGQMSQVYDMQRPPAMKSVEEQSSEVGKVAGDLHESEQGNIAADSHKLGIIEVVSVSAPSESLTTSPQLPHHAIEQTLVVERPKKRKTATSELVPWHKETINVSQRLGSISMAEVEWAKAANRLPEKVEEETEMVDDMSPMLRPRRRLVLTTQLMQQLLRPPPVSIISSDASSQYESTAYSVSRLALGEACSAAGCSESQAPMPGPGGENKDTLRTSSEKLKASKAVDQLLSKVVEDFVGRARRLESELLRLDKKASILDLKVECQDMEKFSVINRFAKFHGRGQPDGPEADGTQNAQKPYPQRPVIPLPMPRNPPDGVQCLSL